jgi:formylglycine-generating enzyme required for sulfatase activity
MAVYGLFVAATRVGTPTNGPASGRGFETTRIDTTSPPPQAPVGMVWIPGGEFSMGCDDPRGQPFGGHDPMPDTRPVHRVHVDGFWMDSTEVTNDQFAAFVAATGYVTVAETPPKAEDFPGAPPENLVAGSIVFSPPEGPVDLGNHYQWWTYVPGADWRHPTGPESSIEGRGGDPVVQIAHDDAVAYATWAGKRLPTEAEWEFAARGGLSGSMYPWGDEFLEDGKAMSNTWQGPFPAVDSGADGYKAETAPVGCFPANGYGLHDMAGNVWEWTKDWYRPNLDPTQIANPAGPPRDRAFTPASPDEKRRVIKGGSFLCADNFCFRYRPPARESGVTDTGSDHTGFRTVLRGG